METLLHSESRGLYSWWWDSHISPRNSRWLQDNLTDMDTKVKAMIRLIEEDADSFARKAEMYYEKRPQLMKLVEEFYRTYRALAERYDQLSGELHQAHCNIAEAFPNQFHLISNEDSHSRSSALDVKPHMPDVPQPSHALPCQDKSADLNTDMIGSVIKNLQGDMPRLRQDLERESIEVEVLYKKLEDMIGFSIKDLQEENSRLRQNHERESVEKEVLSKKLEDMEELSKKKNLLESSLSQLHGELESSRKEVRELQDTSQFLYGANSVLVAEKATLLAQLQTLTENMQAILEKNAVLENSLSGANVELEGLKEKLKGLEEICHLLKNEKFDLLTQRGTLGLQLANAEARVECLETRLEWLEEKYANLKKENKNMQSEVQELTLSLSSEKHERVNTARHHEMELVTMEHHIRLLQQENRWRKKENEDELTRTTRAQFELFILQKFLQDLEEKNYLLLTECERHVEASKLAEKLISELRNENLEQQVEAEILRYEMERTRFGLYRVFEAVEAGSDRVFEDKFENHGMLVHEIIGNIGRIKKSLTEYTDENELLKVENLILLSIIHQMQIEGAEIESKNELTEQELNYTTENLVKQQNDKYRVVQMNDLLKAQLNKGKQEITLLQVGMEILCVKQGETDKDYLDLQEKCFSALEEDKYLREKCKNHEEENRMLKSENDVFLQKRFALVTVATFLESFACEKLFELKQLYEGMHHMTGTEDKLEKAINALKGKLEMKEDENMFLKDLVQKSDIELQGVKDVLRLKEAELSEAEVKFKAEEGMKFELSKALVEVKAKYEGSLLEKENLENHVLELSEAKRIQRKETEDLLEMNANLMSEFCKLHEVCKEHKKKEENLHEELKVKNDEFELWKVEAAEFYFDLQISSIQGVLYENMVHELAEVCGSFEDETFSKTLAIQQLKEKMSLMDSEIGELKADLSAYAPVIASFRDDVASLEHTTLFHLKLEAPDPSKTNCTEATDYTSTSCQDNQIDDQFFLPEGIQDLQILKSRIRAVEKTLVEETKKLVMLKSERRRKADLHEIILEGSLVDRESKGTKELRIDQKSNVNLKNVEPGDSKLMKGISMKDILLDQVPDASSYWCKRANTSIERADDKMLELWEAAENSGLKQHARVKKKPSFVASKQYLSSDQFGSRRWKTERYHSTIFKAEKGMSVDKLEDSSNLAESIQEVNNRKLHDRIASNARKLTSLQLIIENLNRKLEANKKRCKNKNVDLEMVEQQLQEVQESVFQLVEFKDQLMRNTEEKSWHSECQFSAGKPEEAASMRTTRNLQEARKGSEKIGQLQLEVQKLESMLIKLENGKKSKRRSRFSRTTTNIILRDVIYNGKNVGKREKAHLCGCFRASSNCDACRT